MKYVCWSSMNDINHPVEILASRSIELELGVSLRHQTLHIGYIDDDSDLAGLDLGKWEFKNLADSGEALELAKQWRNDCELGSNGKFVSTADSWWVSNRVL